MDVWGVLWQHVEMVLSEKDTNNVMIKTNSTMTVAFWTVIMPLVEMESFGMEKKNAMTRTKTIAADV